MPDAPFQFASGPKRMKPADLVPGVWVTDGRNHKAIPKERPIPDGWQYERDEGMARILVPRIVAQHPDGSTTVRVLQIALPDGSLVEVPDGEHNVPESFAAHWYLPKVGVTQLGPALYAAPSVSPSESAAKPKRQRKPATQRRRA